MSHFVPRVQCEITIITDDIISKLCHQNVKKIQKFTTRFTNVCYQLVSLS